MLLLAFFIILPALQQFLYISFLSGGHTIIAAAAPIAVPIIRPAEKLHILFSPFQATHLLAFKLRILFFQNCIQNFQDCLSRPLRINAAASSGL